MSTKKERILFVGLACFDLVTVCDGYPIEDSDTRALDLEMRRGGNASNSSTCFMSLLSWLKNRDPGKYRDVEVEFFGTMADDPGAAYMKSDFKSCGVLIDNVVIKKKTCSAAAVVTINKQTGTRTIIHCIKNLPELTIQDFELLNLSNYDWIHLEARKNGDEIRQFIRRVRSEDLGRKTTISVEIEKPLESRTVFLQDDVDYFFVSKDYARMKGANGLKEGIGILTDLVTTGNLKSPRNIIVAWGEAGAATRAIGGEDPESRDRKSPESRDGKNPESRDRKNPESQDRKNPDSDIFYSPAFTPKTGVIDTTGAGDAFIAAVIFARQLLRLDMEQAIGFGCKFAGAKCGVMGNVGLEHFDTLI